MSTTGIMRPLRDGGCSICRASEANVGKRRCRHVLDNASMVVVNREDGINLIDISGRVDGKDAEFSIEASSKQIKDYIGSLANGLSEAEKSDILKALRSL